MYRSSQELPDILDRLDICACRIEDEGVLFDYHEGGSFYDHILRQSRLSQEKGLEAWKQMLALLEPKENAEVPFHDSDGFRALFGDGHAFEGERAYPCIAFDLTPANILLQEGKKPVLIDYEWRVAAPVPVALVRYHAAATSCKMNAGMRSAGPPLEQVLELVGMTAPREAYQQALDHFYSTISGDGEDGPAYGEVRQRYEKPVPETLAAAFQAQKGEIAYLQAQIQAMEAQWKQDVALWEAEAAMRSAAQRRCADVEAEAARLSGLLEEKTAAYNSVVNSRTWKLTKPARQFFDLFRS